MSLNKALSPLLAGILFAATLAACSPATSIQPPGSPTPNPDQPVSSDPGRGTPVPALPANPFIPQPGDDMLQRSNVYLDSADLLVMESHPSQYRLALTGNLPTPCHQLRIQFHDPDAIGQIEGEVYSLADAERMCIQVLQPFDVTIPLEYPAGKYSLWINGRQVGTMDVSGPR